MNLFSKTSIVHILLGCFILAYTPIANAKTMSIQVREGQLRSAPSYLSRVVATLNYATRVTIAEEKGPWIRVQTEDGSQKGWIHKSALTKKRLKLASGEKNASTAVSTDEQALAGKGFNSDVEAKFKKDNAEIDFTWVDKMEKIKVPPKKIKKFLKDGDIKPLEGGKTK
jgi:SH3-like domain-containing protein